MRIGRSRRLGLLVIPAAISLAGVTIVRAEMFAITTGVFGVNCVSTGQTCDPPATLVIGDPAKAIKVRKFVYDASAAHCSSGRILIDLDGQRVGKMRFVNRNERATLQTSLRVRPGTHVLSFRFQGKVGGCNAGAVSGWGGQITVVGRR